MINFEPYQPDAFPQIIATGGKLPIACVAAHLDWRIALWIYELTSWTITPCFIVRIECLITTDLSHWWTIVTTKPPGGWEITLFNNRLSAMQALVVWTTDQHLQKCLKEALPDFRIKWFC